MRPPKLLQRYPDYFLTSEELRNLLLQRNHTKLQQVPREKRGVGQAWNSHGSQERIRRTKERNSICGIPTDPRYVPMNRRDLEASRLQTSNRGNGVLWGWMEYRY